jgi:hypothetical protein
MRWTPLRPAVPCCIVRKGAFWTKILDLQSQVARRCCTIIVSEHLKLLAGRVSAWAHLLPYLPQSPTKGIRYLHPPHLEHIWVSRLGPHSSSLQLQSLTLSQYIYRQPIRLRKSSATTERSRAFCVFATLRITLGY